VEQCDGLVGPAAQLFGVRVAREDRNPRLTLIGLAERDQLRPVSPELGQCVDPDRECLRLVRVDRQRGA
jgi:hypothetical protein